MGEKHFLEMFKYDVKTNIGNQLKVIKLFPSFIPKVDVGVFTSQVTLAEVEGAFKGYKRDKSPGPNGWLIEFFLWFFDLVGKDLLRVVELLRIEGKVIKSINSIFFTLIPKCEKPKTFADFRSISLYNLIYKLISKITANGLKPFLDKAISTKQFRFLKNRQILKLMGITQEIL